MPLDQSTWGGAGATWGGAGATWGGAGASWAGAEDEVITTIRVSNVPQHCTEWEFIGWFLFAQGFSGATLSPAKGGASNSGWVRFQTVETAQLAIQHLDGRELPQEQTGSTEPVVLSAAFAKTNYKPTGQAKRQRLTVDQPIASMGAVPPPSTISSLAMPLGVASAGIAATGETCSTLYMNNLEGHTTEEELEFVISQSCHGYERLKFVPPFPGKSSGMCWAKFADPFSAAVALEALSQLALPSNPGVLLQIQFAKNDLDQPTFGRIASPGVAGLGSPANKIVPLNQMGTALPGVVHRQGTPCDTAFLSNFAPTATEQELASFMVDAPGFQRMKFVGEGTARAMAFAQFDSVESCAQAIDIFNGNAMPSAPQQYLKCSFSKTRFDENVHHYPKVAHS